jgi:Serine dehydrogenase proteinase
MAVSRLVFACLTFASVIPACRQFDSKEIDGGPNTQEKAGAPATPESSAGVDSAILERIARYRAIEEKRGRPLVVYATSTRSNATGRIAEDTIRVFMDQIERVPADKQEIDILLHSSGGDGLVACRLMSLLRERFKHVAVLVPYSAMSAATVFALGADEIVMHPFATLGPIDPQITTNLGNGTSRTFSYEDIRAFFRFLDREARIEDEARRARLVEKLLATVDPLFVGRSYRASELATLSAERLLRMHMTSADEVEPAHSIADALNKNILAHNDYIARSRAEALGLPIRRDEQIEELIWDAYVAIEQHLRLREPFVAAGTYMEDQKALLSMAAGQAGMVPYSVINAVAESPRLLAEFRTSGRILGSKDKAGKFTTVAVKMKSGWAEVKMPAPHHE